MTPPSPPARPGTAVAVRPDASPGAADATDKLRPPAAATVGQVLSRGRIRGGIAVLGPAFVASVAYVDPGNFATNFAAGAGHGYSLVWVVVLASAIAIIIQYVTSKVGLATGQSVPELCRTRYARRSNVMLWLQAEAVAMATDLAEFTGAALGLNLLFGLPLLPAGLVTAVVAYAILVLEQRGYRRFERAVVAMLGLVAAGVLYLFVSAGADWAAIGGGLLPRVQNGNALLLTVGIVGATVMPHVIYLHSALPARRMRPSDHREQRRLLRYNRLDCVAALTLAGLVNLAMLCAAAAVFGHLRGNSGTSLSTVHHQLGVLVGGGTALAFAVALIASGFSSASVGTYAGQVVMAGFMNWHIPLPLRRTLTMLPALALLALSADATDALIYSQIVLSFGIPFALVPLVRLSSMRGVMGQLVNRRRTTIVMWAVTALISGLNLYLIVSIVAGG